MVRMEDHVPMIGDWVPPSPGSKHFFSSFLCDNVGSKSFLELPGEYTSSSIFTGSQEQMVSGISNETHARHDGFTNGGQLNELNNFFEQCKASSGGGGGLVERLAARAGFNAPRINTKSISRSADLSLNPDVSSPYLTIPPGLSPTTLLDSPVFLSNSLAQPSPTTGKFFISRNSNNKGSKMVSEIADRSNDNNCEDISLSSFAIRPVIDSGSSLFSSAAAMVTPATISQVDLSIPNTTAVGGSDKCSPLDDKQDEGVQRETGDSVIGAPSEDGYNWRKYGQKQVKGSEYPRGYYKCTHPNCQVKKKVEQSHEGHITEIIYKGGHNHPKPFPNRRSAIGSSNPYGDMQLDTPDCDLIWQSTQKGTGARVPEWRNDSLEGTSVASEFCNQSSGLQAQNGPYVESGDAVDASSTFSNNEDEDDRQTHGSVSLGGYDGEGHEESESKRRKLESYATEMNGTNRAIREPRVVVQTTSEVDILDDGYRWRKYGQKVVKGNPNPRSYYKCTNAGCTVRKHVERASHDLKSVITTYEGKHNHDVPVARNSSHINNSTTASNASLPHQTASFGSFRQQQQQQQQQQHQQQQQQLGPTNGFSFGMNQPQPGYSSLTMPGLSISHNTLPILPVNQYLGQPYQYQLNDIGFMMPKGEPKV